jgi:capsule polysaccharide modification protein KpsS
VDEMHVIKSIAFRLPSDVRLVVKEHPSAVAMQPREFYKQLSELPNVDLLAAHVSAKLLARESVGIVCVTSTLGFEAAAMGKPVIALGDVLYGYFPNVRMINTCADIGAALGWALTYQECPKQEVLEAMAAYAAFTVEGAFDFRASLGDKAALQGVANLLNERIADARRESSAA